MLQALARILRTHPRAASAQAGQRDPLGPAGEKLAAAHLRRAGYRVLGRNLRVPMGEADLLCRAPDRRTMVLVEVKTRRAETAQDGSGPAVYAPPELSVTAEKRRKLAAILGHLVRANNWGDRARRIDVVAIEWPAEGDPVLRHHVDAVRVEQGR